MKMESMVQYLEGRGFAVTKKYDITTHEYLFEIEKDGHVLRSYFKYPEEYKNREQKQLDFLESMVKEFTFKNDVLDRLNAPETTYNPARDLIDHCSADVSMTNYLYKHISMTTENWLRDNIKDVIFNPPATIVFWKDNTKTVVKTQYGESYDPEKGLAMAMCKKMLGNKGNYFNVFRKWTDEYYADTLTDYWQGFLDKISDIINGSVVAGDGNPPKETEENTDELQD